MTPNGAACFFQILWAALSEDAMKRQLVLVLCWLAMFGNIAIWMLGTELAVHERSFSNGIGICVIALLSFSCAFILRRVTVKSIREGAQRPDRD
jgi:hypothetical protein